MARLLLLLLLFSFHLAIDAGSVLICGVCQNVSPSLENTIENIEKLGSQFANYAVVIYENDSSDDTVDKLRQWAKKNRHVAIITEKLAPEMLSLCRTEKISNARNKLLAEVRKKKYRKFKHLVMADLDFKTPWPIEEIVQSVNLPGEWDCISANGITNSGVYRDRLAFRSKNYPFGPEVLDGEFWRDLVPGGSGWFGVPPDMWLPVYSAFGGLAIYKTKTICQFSYSGKVTQTLKNYYKKILASLPDDSPELKKYLNLNGKKRAGKHLRFRKNCREWQSPDDDSIAVCEHVTLHAQMALKGHGKFYINPRMVMRY